MDAQGETRRDHGGWLVYDCPSNPMQICHSDDAKGMFFIKSVFFTLFFKKKNVFLHTFQIKYYLCPKLDAYQFICT